MSEKQKVAAFMTPQNGGKMVQSIKEIIAAIGLDGRIEVVEIPRIRELELALVMLSCGGCWCGIGIGDPRIKDHGSTCLHVQKLLKRQPIEVDDHL